MEKNTHFWLKHIIYVKKGAQEFEYKNVKVILSSAYLAQENPLGYLTNTFKMSNICYTTYNIFCFTYQVIKKQKQSKRTK